MFGKTELVFQVSFEQEKKRRQRVFSFCGAFHLHWTLLKQSHDSGFHLVEIKLRVSHCRSVVSEIPISGTKLTDSQLHGEEKTEKVNFFLCKSETNMTYHWYNRGAGLSVRVDKGNWQYLLQKGLNSILPCVPKHGKCDCDPLYPAIFLVLWSSTISWSSFYYFLSSFRVKGQILMDPFRQPMSQTCESSNRSFLHCNAAPLH